MVMDNGCDQSIINNDAFYVKSFAGVLYNVGGALHGMQASSLELVNEAYTLITLPDSKKIIVEFNQCFLDRDPLQTEALLQPHQARAFGVIVDNCASCHLGSDGQPGGQCIMVDFYKGRAYQNWFSAVDLNLELLVYTDYCWLKIFAQDNF